MLCRVSSRKHETPLKCSIVPSWKRKKGHGANRIGRFHKRKIPLFPWAFKQGALTRSNLILQRLPGTCHHEAVPLSCSILWLRFRSRSTSSFSSLHAYAALDLSQVTGKRQHRNNGNWATRSFPRFRVQWPRGKR